MQTPHPVRQRAQSTAEVAQLAEEPVNPVSAAQQRRAERTVQQRPAAQAIGTMAFVTEPRARPVRRHQLNAARAEMCGCSCGDPVLARLSEARLQRPDPCRRFWGDRARRAACSARGSSCRGKRPFPGPYFRRPTAPPWGDSNASRWPLSARRQKIAAAPGPTDLFGPPQRCGWSSPQSSAPRRANLPARPTPSASVRLAATGRSSPKIIPGPCSRINGPIRLVLPHRLRHNRAMRGRHGPHASVSLRLSASIDALIIARIPALTGAGRRGQAWKTRARSASSTTGLAVGLSMGLEKRGPSPVIRESSPGTEAASGGPPEVLVPDICKSCGCWTLGVSGHPQSPSCIACREEGGVVRPGGFEPPACGLGIRFFALAGTP